MRGVFKAADSTGQTGNIMGLRSWLAGIGATKAEGAPDVLRIDGLNVSGVVEPPDDARSLLNQYREWVYACVTKNADVVASTPLRLYATRRTAARRSTGLRHKLATPVREVSRKARDEIVARSHMQKYIRLADDFVEVLEHPFLNLWEDGNPFLTGTQQKCVIVMHLDLVGDNYTLIESDAEYGPTMLLTLPPETMKIQPRPDQRGIECYVQTREGQVKGTPIPPGDITHFKHPDPKNPLYGMSPLEAIGLAANLYHEYNQFESALINNDGIPSTLVRTENRLSRTQELRIERKWQAKHGGPKRAGNLAFVHGILGVDRIGFAPRDMMFQIGRKLSREDIAGVFSVPIPLLIADGSALAQGQDAEKHHARYAIKPRCALIEEQINRDIIPKYPEGEGLFVAFDNPVPEDRAHNLERAKVMVTSSGFVFKNEARAALELTADPDMDEELIEGATAAPGGFGGNTGPQGGDDAPEAADGEYDADEGTPVDAADVKAAPAAPLDFTRALQRLFAEQRREMLSKLKAYSRQLHEIEMQLKGIATPRRKIGWASNIDVDSAFDVDAWTQRYYDELKPFLEVGLVAGGEAGLDRIGSPGSFDIQRPEVADFIADYTYRFSFATNATTQGALRDIFTSANAEGQTLAEVTNRVQDHFSYAERYRAARIARTETARARQGGELESWKQSGVVQGYYWETSTANPCEYCIEMAKKFGKDGVHLTFGDNFIDRGGSAGAEGLPPMAMNYSDIPHPPLHPNCGCMTVPILAGEDVQILEAGEVPIPLNASEFRMFDNTDDALLWEDGAFHKYGAAYTDLEKSALGEYVAGGTTLQGEEMLVHEAINRTLRTGRALPKTLSEIADATRSAIAKTTVPSNVVVWRGLNAREWYINADKMVGTVIRDKGFLSTSFDKGVATEFTRLPGQHYPVACKVFVPKGTHGVSMSTALHGELHTMEQVELLLENGQELFVRSAKTVTIGGTRMKELTLEVMPNG